MDDTFEVKVLEVKVLLSDSLTPRGVKQWLHARNRLLEGARPIDVLAEDGFEQVWAAAQSFIDGTYF